MATTRSEFMGENVYVLHNGKANSYGSIEIYDFFSGEKSESYTTSFNVIKNPNPVILTGSGTASIYLDTGKTYDITMKDKNGSVVWTETEYKADCLTGGTCYNFTVSDGMGGHNNFLADSANFLVGDFYGSCGAYDPLADIFGVDCSMEELGECPPCLSFNSYLGNGIFERLVAFDEPLAVSLTPGSCAPFPDLPPEPVSEGLDCYGVDPCPPCATFRTWDGTYPDENNLSSYDVFVVGLPGQVYTISSLIEGGCTDAPPPLTVPTVPVLTASTTLTGVVDLSWTASTGNPVPYYLAYRDGVQIGNFTDLLEYQDIIAGGNYTYTVEALNSEGSAMSLPVVGTSLVATGVLPSPIVDFAASNDVLDFVDMTFTQPAGGDVPITHDLWRQNNAVWELAVVGITSGYQYNGLLYSASTNYRLESVNAAGSVTGNIDEGKALLSGVNYFYVEDAQFSPEYTLEKQIDDTCFYTEGSGGCTTDAVFVVINVNNTNVSSYTWEVVGATIESGQGTDAIVVSTPIGGDDIPYTVKLTAIDEFRTTIVTGDYVAVKDLYPIEILAISEDIAGSCDPV